MVLLDEITAKVADGGFSIFGMSTSDSINMIIAIVAVFGFITSMIVSIYTLRHTKNLHLINDRRDVLLALLDFTHIAEPSLENLLDFATTTKKLLTLFKNNEKTFISCMQLNAFYHENKSLPDYTKQYKKAMKRADKEINIKNAFIYHCQHQIVKIGKNIIR